MWVKNPIFSPEILKSGYPLDFFGLFHTANSYDHRAEIKFQRISAKKMLKNSGFSPTSVLQRVIL